MIKKLIIRNIKRSFGDYSIYFLTLILSISLIYSFLSLAFSEEVLSLSENMSQLKGTMTSISILVGGIVAFTVSYATKFIISKRKKEFALYQLLGMERKKISHLFFIENGIIGFIACIFGILLGSLLSQIFKSVILNIFDTPYELKMGLSWNSVIFTFALFAIMYLINIYKSSVIIYKEKIINLLNQERFNEKPIRDNKSRIIFGSIMYSILMIISFFVLKASTTVEDNMIFIYFLICFTFISIGINGITINSIYLILLERNKLRKWKYYRTNIVVLKQISSRINSYGKTIGVLAILLFFALISMDFGLSMGVAYKANIKTEAPFDIAIGFGVPNVENFNEIVEFIDSNEVVEEYVSYQIYENRHIADIPILALRDYNHLRVQLQLDQKTISENQYIIHSDTWSTLEKMKKNLQGNNEIYIEKEPFTTNERLIFTEPFEQYQMNGINGIIMVVPDEVVSKLTPIASRLVVTTVNGAPPEMKDKINHFIREEWNPIADFSKENKITMTLSVKEWSVANGLTALSLLSFGSLYLSLIIIILIGTIMALQEIYSSEKSKYEYKLIYDMGVSKNEISCMIRKQISNTFFYPIALPILITVIFATYGHITLGALILQKNVIPYCTFITLTIFVVIYGMYYFTTYKIYEKNIFRFIKNK